MPAEWEPHEATWLGWFQHEPGWPADWEEGPAAFAKIARALQAGERVEIVCPDDYTRQEARRLLDAAGVQSHGYRLHVIPSERAWMRDISPMGVLTHDGDVELLHWQRTSWTRSDDFAHEAKVGHAVERVTGLRRSEPTHPTTGRIALDGGAIDVNGTGLLLATEEHLLSAPRIEVSGLDRAGFERLFAEHLGVRETIWLGEGVAHDRTQGHVDNVARFVARDVIVLGYEPDPAADNHARSVDNLRRLELAGGSSGRFRVVTVPFPQPLAFEERRLPASYLNFYCANGVLLVPTFRDGHDAFVLETIARLVPGRLVVGIDVLPLIHGGGTVHCLTQQQPMRVGCQRSKTRPPRA